MIEKIYRHKFFKVVLFLVILGWGIYLRINHLESKYSFNWDQETDAYKVMSIIEERKLTLIGPRAVSDAGFFFGPYHYYFLVPFYMITQGDPIAGAYAAITVAVITVVLGFFVAYRVFGLGVAFSTEFFLANSFDITSWNVMYIKAMSILFFFFCWRGLSNGKYYFGVMFLLGLMINTHASAITLIPVVLYVWWIRKQNNLKKMMVGFLFFLLPFLPLIIFDLRHDFLNITNVIELFRHSENMSSGENYLFLRTFWRAINFSDMPFGGAILYFLIRVISLGAIGAIIMGTNNSRYRLLMIIWVVSPLLFLAFYKGNIPEYYYGILTALLPMWVAGLLWQIPCKKIILPALILMVGYYTLINQYFPTVSLAHKKAVVSYLVNQKTDEYFNVSYDLPLGWDNGYEYLFKYYQRLPDRSPRGHLYSIVSLPTNQGGVLVYQSGIVGVIRR
jgi:hypothetical protein